MNDPFTGLNIDNGRHWFHIVHFEQSELLENLTQKQLDQIAAIIQQQKKIEVIAK